MSATQQQPQMDDAIVHTYKVPSPAYAAALAALTAHRAAPPHSAVLRAPALAHAVLSCLGCCGETSHCCTFAKAAPFLTHSRRHR